ncbi:hypothetical protein BH24CHL4_BH24CHL4_27180 [soil metagenome]
MSVERDSAVATSIYQQMGVRTVINARGATTAAGGTLSDPQRRRPSS